MAVFVTGGAGFIGSHTCVELLNRGYSVIIADNFCNSKPEALENIRNITKKDFVFYEADLRDRQKLDAIFSAHEVDVVIHFAGLKAVGESVSIPLAYYDNNLNSTLTLCQAMEKHKINQIIFSSSATVYRGDAPMPLSETSATGGCTNPYGWTKFMCEQILTDAAAANPDWSVVLLRYFNPIGAHESGLLGEAPGDIPNNLMPYVAQTAAGLLPELRIYGNDYNTPDGTGVRDYIHVVDLARGHAAAIDYCIRHKGAEVFNLGTGKGTSVLEIVKTFEKTNHVKVPYRITDRRPGDLAVCYADTQKASRDLGWAAKKGLAEMCADLWRWQQRETGKSKEKSHE